ncbi:hypothetical protein [Flavobacterium marginilacus]|uniref:hypothetical protein n=1 Tax=Flavobacterium marginilacus TaxID=3003256 RepID=UPI00248D9599|nr:hypothetical protein [Flavobacterium marginilacus]
MKLKKITDKGKTGNFDIGQGEILICSWNNGVNPDFYAFDISKIIRKVDEEYFAKAVVGENYKKIEEILPEKVHNYRITKSNNGEIYFCTFQEGIIYGFDNFGNSILNWDIEVGEGHPIYDIKFQEPDFLWLAFPTGQTVTQVSLTDKQEVFKIGEYSWEDNYEPLSYPESVFVDENNLYIPNMGNKKLFKLDLKTKEINLTATFEEKIWQYGKTEIGTFIVTDTGIYELENEAE